MGLYTVGRISTPGRSGLVFGTDSGSCGPKGFPDVRVNAFLASARMRNLAETSQRDYAHALALWLNFLETRYVPWWDASIEDAEEFEFWRLTDPANAAAVGTSAFAKDVAACKKFYDGLQLDSRMSSTFLRK